MPEIIQPNPRKIHPDFDKALDLLMLICHVITSPVCQINVSIPQNVPGGGHQAANILQGKLRQAISQAGGLCMKWKPGSFEKGADHGKRR